MRLRRPDPFLVALAVIGAVVLIVLGPWSDTDADPAGVLAHQVSTGAAGSVHQVDRSSTSSSSSTSTSTTSAPATDAPTPPASVTTRGETTPIGAGADVAELRTTAYCLRGHMANGRPTHVGAVASNRFALGTRVTAWPNPWGDPAMVFTVEDRHARSDAAGYPTEFDFAMPGECDRALAWGNRQHARVEVSG